MNPTGITNMVNQLADNRFDLEALSETANPDADPALFQEILNQTASSVPAPDAETFSMEMAEEE